VITCSGHQSPWVHPATNCRIYLQAKQPKNFISIETIGCNMARILLILNIKFSGNYRVKSFATYLFGMCCLIAAPTYATTITNSLVVNGMASISDPSTVTTFGPTVSSNYVSDTAWIPAITDGQGNINASTNSSFSHA
jgi:hypothetical protein